MNQDDQVEPVSDRYCGTDLKINARFRERACERLSDAVVRGIS